VTASLPQPPRRFDAPDGRAWEARITASGRPSPYLAPRLGRPVVEFRCFTAPDLPRTYALLPVTSLADLTAEGLVALWCAARPY